MALGLVGRLPRWRSLSSMTIFSVVPRGLLWVLMGTKRGFLHSVGCLGCAEGHIGLDLLLILAHERLPGCQGC